jgi:hypothetical protein
MPKVPDSIASSLQHDEDIPCSGIKLVHEAHYRIDITVSIRPVTRPWNGWSSNAMGANMHAASRAVASYPISGRREVPSEIVTLRLLDIGKYSCMTGRVYERSWAVAISEKMVLRAPIFMPTNSLLKVF